MSYNADRVIARSAAALRPLRSPLALLPLVCLAIILLLVPASSHAQGGGAWIVTTSNPSAPPRGLWSLGSSAGFAAPWGVRLADNGGGVNSGEIWSVNPLWLPSHQLSVEFRAWPVDFATQQPNFSGHFWQDVTFLAGPSQNSSFSALAIRLTTFNTGSGTRMQLYGSSGFGSLGYSSEVPADFNGFVRIVYDGTNVTASIVDSARNPLTSISGTASTLFWSTDDWYIGFRGVAASLCDGDGCHASITNPHLMDFAFNPSVSLPSPVDYSSNYVPYAIGSATANPATLNLGEPNPAISAQILNWDGQPVSGVPVYYDSNRGSIQSSPVNAGSPAYLVSNSYVGQVAVRMRTYLSPGSPVSYAYITYQGTPPTIASVANQTTDEDTPVTFNVTIGDANISSATLSATPGNPALTPANRITFGGSGANRTVTVAPGSNQYGSGQITLTATNQFGLTSSTSFNLTVNPLNDAPAVDQSKLFRLTGLLEDPAENPGNTVISLLGNGVAVSDPDPSPLLGIAVVGHTGGGAWQFSLDSGASWQPIGAVSDASALLLRGSDQVRFVPDPNWNSSQGAAALSFRGWDQTSGSAGERTAVAPNGGESAFGAAVVSTGVTVTAVNDLPAPQSDTLALVEDNAASGTLSATDIEGSPLTYSVLAQPAKGVVVISDPATGAYTYTPAADAEGGDSFTFRAYDGEDYSPAGEISVTIAPVNDAPALDPGGVFWLTGISEDPTANLGTTVGALLNGGAAVSDPDLGAQYGIAVVGADASSGGTWQYSTDAGATWLAFGGPTASSARLLASTARVRFAPAADWNGSPAGLTLRAWDQTSGTNGGSADTTSSGGATAFSPTTVLTGVAVAPVNDAPVAQSGSLTVGEDAAASGTFAAADIDSAALTFSIVAPPEQGSLTIDNPATGAFTYTPAPDASGLDTVVFRAYDGQDYSAPAAVTIAITPANDPPITWDAGSILSFAGTDQLSVADAPELRIAGNLTIEAWVNPVAQSGPANLLGKGAGSGEYLLRLNDRNPNDGLTQLEFYQQGASLSYQPGEVTIPVGRWSHIAVVRSADATLRFYVNGSLVLKKPLSGAPSPTSTPLLIGQGYYGLLDEVRIWNVARSRAEIAANTTATVSGATPGLVSYWRFNEAFGAQALDSAGGLSALVSGAARVASSAFTTDRLTPISGRLAIGDREGDPLSYRVVTQPTRGQITITSVGLGAFTYLPSQNASGSDSFVVQANDGLLDSPPVTVSISIQNVNTPPTLGPIADQTIRQGEPAAPIALAVGDAESDPASLVLAATSSNQALLPDSGIVFGGSGAARTLSISPIADLSGSAVVTVTVSDGVASAQRSFALTFVANRAPTISPIPDQNVIAGAAIGPVAFTVDDSETPAGGLALSADSSNPALIAASGISFGGAGAARTLTIAPQAGQSGSVIVGILLSDGVNTTRRSFQVNVAPRNQPPTISPIADQAIAVDGSLGPLSLTVLDAESAAGTLTVSATSSNPALVADAAIQLGGSGADRMLSLTPVAGQSGVATIFVRVSDGDAVSSRSFSVTVGSANPGAPTLTPIADQSAVAGGSLGPLAFTIADADTPLDSLLISASSDSQSLVADGAISLAGSGAARTLTLSTAAGQSGVAIITVRVSDGSDTAEARFALNIAAAGQAPTVSPIADQTVGEGGSLPPLSFTIGDADSSPGSLTVSLSSDNQALVPDTALSLGGSGAGRSLTITPAQYASGVAVITVRVSDGTFSASASFSLTVVAVDNPPTITTIADQTIEQDNASGALVFMIDDIETPATNLRLSASSSNPSLVDASGIVFSGSGRDRSVTITPRAYQTGTARISVSVGDGGQSSSVTFTVTVTPAGRGTRTYGQVRITADSFTSAVGSGVAVASGNVWLGDYLMLADPSGSVTITLADSQIGGSGTLRLRSGELDLLQGPFGAAGATGLLTPGPGASSPVDSIAGFAALPGLKLSRVNLLSGTSSGSATIRLNPEGIDTSAGVGFTIAPGPIYGGTLDAFTLALAGTELSIPAGVQLGNNRIDVPALTLKLPASLGGATTALSQLAITPSSFSLSGGEMLLPNIAVGSGKTLRFTDNQASLVLVGGAYQFALKSTLSLNLPGNVQTSSVNLTLRDSGGAQISGTLDGLILQVAGGKLALTNVAIGNAGLSVASAQFALPADLGGSVAVSGVSIGDGGLAIAGGSFALPAITIAGGSTLRIGNASGSLALVDGSYTLSASGTLGITLPDNALSSQISFSIDGNGRLRASASSLSIALAGAALKLGSFDLANSGLSASNVALSLPASLGGASGTLSRVRITGAGLDFGSAGLTLGLPDISLGTPIKLTRNSALLGIGSGAAGPTYELSISSQLNLSLPGNSSSSAINLTMRKDASGAQLSGTLSQLRLKIAGGTLGLSSLSLSAAGLAAAQGSYTLAPPLSATGSVNAIRIGSDGLSIGGGSFALPAATIGSSGKLKISDATARLLISGNAYALDASGKLILSLPENSQQLGFGFQIDGSGQLKATIAQLALKMAGTQVAMQQIALGNSGLLASNAALKLPASLGGASGSIQSVQIDDNGLSFGAAGLSVTLPKFSVGTRLSFDQNRASLAIAAGAAAYRLDLTSKLSVDLPGNKQTSDFSFSMLSDGGDAQLSGTLSALNLQLTGGTLALRELAVSRDGFTVNQATYTLPPSLGGSAAVRGVKITRSDLAFDGGKVTFPTITFGSAGSRLQLGDPQVALATKNGLYTLNGSGRLRLSLPGNNLPESALAFSISSDGQFSASLDRLVLKVAGSDLTLSSLLFTNSGMQTDSATLTLPARYGSPSASAGGVSITKDGLRLRSASIALGGSIRFGSRLAIDRPTVSLSILPDSYSLLASGTLNANLPGNQISTPISFLIDGEGNFKGAIEQLNLKIAGSALALSRVQLTNDGLQASVASLTIRGANATVRNVQINGDGLQFSAGQISLPANIALAGPKAVLLQPKLGFELLSDGYGIILSGDVLLDLPQNRTTVQGVTVRVTSGGEFSGQIGALTLRLGQVDLGLSGLTITSDGLQVSSGTLKLPSSLGGATGSVSAIRIDANGLAIGAAGAEIPFPNITIGSASAGVSIGSARASITVAADYSYSVTIGGTATVRFPGASGSATGTITLRSDGSVRGSVSGMSLSLAGMSVDVQGFRIENDSLYADRAGLTLPAAYGGASVAVYNLQISPSGISIGGGKFELPGIKVGGFTMGLKGELRREGGGYIISAGGTFQAPGLGSAGGCSGIGVSVTIFADGFGQMAMRIDPPDTPAEQRFVAEAIAGAPQPIAVANAPYGGDGPTLDSISLREASLTLYCQIPIGQTGMFLTKVSGTVSLNGSVVQVSIEVEIAAGRKVLDIAVMSANAKATLTSQPFQLDINGIVKVFIFQVGGAQAVIKSDSFRATLWIDMITARGNATVKAWSDSGGFKFTGSGRYQMGIPKGRIFSGCVPVVDTPCVDVPPVDLIYQDIGAEIGAFKGDHWGLKAWITRSIPILDRSITVSAFVDTRGTLSIGNVDDYQLEQGPAARNASPGLAAQSQAAAGTVDSPVQVQAGSDPTFMLSRLGDAPQLRIVDPSGSEYTPSNLPKQIEHSQYVTYTVVPDLSWYAPQATYAPAGGALAPLTNQVTTARLAAAQLQLTTVAADALPAPRLRLLNAMSSDATLDTLIDGVALGSSVGRMAAGAYQAIAPGLHTLTLVAAGTSGPALATAQVELLPTIDYSLAAVGPSGGLGLRLIADNNRYRGERIQMRVVNLSDSAVTVREIGGRAWFTGVAAGSVSAEQQLFTPMADLIVEQPSGATLATLGQLQTSAGNSYTLLVSGPAGQVTATLLPDAAAPARLSVSNLLGGGSVDLLVNGKRDARFSAAAAGGRSDYQPFVPGEYTLALVPAGTTGPALASASVTLAPGADYTLLGFLSGAEGRTALLNDTSIAPPDLGQARVRLINGASDGLPLDLAEAGQPAPLSSADAGAAGGYAVLSAGSHDLELRRNGALLLSLPGTQLPDGATIAILVSGSGAQLQAAPATELLALRQTVETYSVRGATPGTWLQRLVNVPQGGPPTFMNAAFANPRPPQLGAAQAVATGPQSARVSWQLTSTQPLGVSVFATTATPDKEDNTGTLLLDGVALPADGSTQSADVDLSALPSGTYYLYLAASNGDMPAVRAYAPQPIQVVQSWPATWDAKPQVMARYRALDLSWQPHPSPDVSAYVLEVAEKGGLGATRVITVGKLLNFQLTNLSPGITYNLKLRAVDEQLTRSATAATFSGVPLGAEFTLGSSATSLTTRAGEPVSLNLTLTTALSEYPEIVGLAAAQLPQGLSVSFSTNKVLPTVGGATVQVQIWPTTTLPSGQYRIPLVAQGAGAQQTLDLQIRVRGRGFALVPVALAELDEGKTLEASIPTRAINGSSAPIALSLSSVPSGLDYTLTPSVIPGQPATLKLIDTSLLASGAYALQLRGSDGPNVVTQTLILSVVKRGFSVTAERVNLPIEAGQRIYTRIAVAGYGGWGSPVTLGVTPGRLADGVTVGFSADDPRLPGVTSSSTIAVMPGQQVWLSVSVAAGSADGVYGLPISAQSGERTQETMLYLGVNMRGWLGDVIRVLLPLVWR